MCFHWLCCSGIDEDSNHSPSLAKHWAWREGKRPLVLGHRGVPRAAQENTIAALEAAVALGIDGVEIDVFVTADNVVVLFHDEDVGRLTGGKATGSIADMTYAQVSELRIAKVLDATGTGQMQEFESEQRIPTLEQVLNQFPTLRINIEMKAYGPKWGRRHWGTAVAKVIRSCNAADRVIVTSFDFFMLRELEREYPGLQSGFAYDDNMSGSLAEASEQWYKRSDDEDQIGAFEARDSPGFVRWLMESNQIGKAVGSTVVDLEWTCIDSNTIDKFHKRGHAVGAYVFFPFDVSFVQTPLSDEEEETVIRRLVAEGVDWLETDDPEKLMALLTRIESE
eukprot:m.184821 g.184821  ORF g.184821 m.184821 type:complete len:337 (+) comp14721_c1_seq1:40-1050(+)